MESIILAAAELFAEYGYAATTMQMVAEKAGVAPSGIYYYYAGKQDLLMEVSNRLCDDIYGAFDCGEGILSENTDLSEVIDFSFGIMLANASKVRLVVMLLLQKNLPQECRERLKDVEYRFVSYITGWFHTPELIEEATLLAFETFAALFLLAVDKNESWLELYRPRAKRALLELLEEEKRLDALAGEMG